MFNQYRVSLPVPLYLFARAAREGQRAVADLEDGSDSGDHLLFSGSAASARLIPDPAYFVSNGYAGFRAAVAG